MPKCLPCQRPLPPRQAGAGRPPRYCSQACKRQAGYEVTRLTRAISELEALLSRYRCGLVTDLGRDAARIEAELARQRGGLHRLLLNESEEAG